MNHLPISNPFLQIPATPHVISKLIEVLTQELNQAFDKPWHPGKHIFHMSKDFDIYLTAYPVHVWDTVIPLAMAPFLETYKLVVDDFGTFQFTRRPLNLVTLEGTFKQADCVDSSKLMMSFDDQRGLRSGSHQCDDIDHFIWLSHHIRQAFRNTPDFAEKAETFCIHLTDSEVLSHLTPLDDNCVALALHTAFNAFEEQVSSSRIFVAEWHLIRQPPTIKVEFFRSGFLR